MYSWLRLVKSNFRIFILVILVIFGLWLQGHVVLPHYNTYTGSILKYFTNTSSISKSHSLDSYSSYASLKYRQIIKREINLSNIHNWQYFYNLTKSFSLWKKITIKYYLKSENQLIVSEPDNEDKSGDFQYFGLPGVWFCSSLEQRQQLVVDALKKTGFPFLKVQEFRSLFCLNWQDYEKLLILMKNLQDQIQTYSSDDIDPLHNVTIEKASSSWIKNRIVFKFKSLDDSNEQKAYENFFNSFNEGELSLTTIFWSDRLVLDSKIISKQNMSLSHPEIYFNMANLYQQALKIKQHQIQLLRNLAWQQQENGTLIVTFINSKYHASLMNWLIHLNKGGVGSGSSNEDERTTWPGREKSVSNKRATGVLIVCLDTVICQWLHRNNIPCFLILSSSAKRSAGKNGKKIHTKLGNIWFQRTYHINLLLTFGLSIILSDVDAVWIDNPKFLHYISNDNLIMSRGNFPQHIKDKWGFAGCMGWVLYKPHVMNLLLSTKIMCFMKSEQPDDQVAVNVLLNQLVEPFNASSSYSETRLRTQWNLPPTKMMQENGTDWATLKVRSILPWYNQYQYKANKTMSDHNIPDDVLKESLDIKSTDDESSTQSWFFRSITNKDIRTILIGYSVAILPYSIIERYCKNETNGTQNPRNYETRNQNPKLSMPYIYHCRIRKNESLRENTLKELGLWKLSDDWGIKLDRLYKKKKNSLKKEDRKSSINNISYNELLQLMETQH